MKEGQHQKLYVDKSQNSRQKVRPSSLNWQSERGISRRSICDIGSATYLIREDQVVCLSVESSARVEIGWRVGVDETGEPSSRNLT